MGGGVSKARGEGHIRVHYLDCPRSPARAEGVHAEKIEGWSTHDIEHTIPKGVKSLIEAKDVAALYSDFITHVVGSQTRFRTYGIWCTEAGTIETEHAIETRVLNMLLSINTPHTHTDTLRSPLFRYGLGERRVQLEAHLRGGIEVQRAVPGEGHPHLL
jgi:hypothetical protein